MKRALKILSLSLAIFFLAACSQTHPEESSSSSSLTSQAQVSASETLKTSTKSTKTSTSKSTTSSISETSKLETSTSTSKQSTIANRTTSKITSSTSTPPPTSTQAQSNSTATAIAEPITLSIDVSVLAAEDLPAKTKEKLQGQNLGHTTTISFKENMTVLKALELTAQEQGLSLDVSYSFLGAYVRAIHHLYEKAYGGISGWTYEVNGEQLPIACDQAILEPGDHMTWRYVK